MSGCRHKWTLTRSGAHICRRCRTIVAHDRGGTDLTARVVAKIVGRTLRVTDVQWFEPGQAAPNLGADPAGK